MNQTETLTLKQDSFCVHYTTIGTETYSNGTKSAIAAGYSEKGAYARASELLRNRKVWERISALHKENMSRNNVTPDSVLANIEHDRMLAREKGDISSAIRADELQGKTLAMFKESHLIGQDEQQRKLNELEQRTARELAVILMERRLEAGSPKPAEPVQQAQSS
jgi:hypothetical protein